MSISSSEILERIRKGEVNPELKRSLARGVLPLGPAAMIEILIHLTSDPEKEIRDDAIKSLKKLPPSVAVGVCEAEDTPGPLLNKLARLFPRNGQILEKILLNPAVSDTTVAHIATLPFPELLEIAGRNHERLMRSPQIVANLKSNKKTPVVILNLWEEAEERRRRKEKVREEAEARAARRKEEVEPGDGDLPPELVEEQSVSEGGELKTAHKAVEQKKQTIIQMLRVMTAGQKVGLAMKGNSEVRKILIREKNRLICEKVLENPKITDSEIESFAKSTNMSEDVLRNIAKRREWVKIPSVTRALVHNPKTPLGISMGFVKGMSVRELEGLSRNRNVPEALRKTATKMYKQKLQKQK